MCRRSTRFQKTFCTENAADMLYLLFLFYMLYGKRGMSMKNVIYDAGHHISFLYDPKYCHCQLSDGKANVDRFSGNLNLRGISNHIYITLKTRQKYMADTLSHETRLHVFQYTIATKMNHTSGSIYIVQIDCRRCTHARFKEPKQNPDLFVLSKTTYSSTCYSFQASKFTFLARFVVMYISENNSVPKLNEALVSRSFKNHWPGSNIFSVFLMQNAPQYFHTIKRFCKSGKVHHSKPNVLFLIHWYHTTPIFCQVPRLNMVDWAPFR